jgi:hypothetical protein
MTNDIAPIPEVPARLHGAAEDRTLIPFVGAGASRLAGCPDWNEFANAALREFVERGKFTHAQIDQVKHLNPRIRLSIALSLQSTTGIKIDFQKLLHREPRQDHATGQQLYSHLSKLAKTFVTTNYDEWLDEEIPVRQADLSGASIRVPEPTPRPRTVIYRPSDLTVENLDREDAVIHLHGSVKEPEGMILTTLDYVRHYANDRRYRDQERRNYVPTFLEHLFRNKTVLFVGYGLDELEILEYIIVKAPTTDETARPPGHFLLQGFFSHERELMVNTRTYYRECGIELIPFLRDRADWMQLVYVLESFARSVPASPRMMSQQDKEMEDLLHG